MKIGESIDCSQHSCMLLVTGISSIVMVLKFLSVGYTGSSSEAQQISGVLAKLTTTWCFGFWVFVSIHWDYQWLNANA